jgi:hypothetical protein
MRERKYLAVRKISEETAGLFIFFFFSFLSFFPSFLPPKGHRDRGMAEVRFN